MPGFPSAVPELFLPQPAWLCLCTVSVLFFQMGFERREAGGGLSAAGIGGVCAGREAVCARGGGWLSDRVLVGVFNDTVAYYFSLEPLNCLVHKQFRE